MDCKNNLSTFARCKVGQTYFIKEISKGLEDKYYLRLLELGFLPGEKLIFKQRSLKKKTFLVQVRGVMFSLQENIANFVVLEEL